MAPFSKNVTFIGVNLLDLCRQDTATAAKVFAEVWEFLNKGAAMEKQKTLEDRKDDITLLRLIHMGI